MADAARSFSSPGKCPAKIPEDIGFSGPISGRLAGVAAAFVELQQARYLADYDVLDAAGEVNLPWAQECLEKVDAAFQDWSLEKGSEGARVFLAALLLWKNWGKKS